MKKSIHILVALQIAFFSNFAFSSGADFAGNGGGRPENNIRYVFHNMYKFIEDFTFHCQKARCHINTAEFQDLYKIKAKAFELSFKPDSLVYCYEQQACPVSFQTKAGEPHRSMLAKNEKVFINISHFYNDNKPASDLTETLSLLFHEIGHLAGVKNSQVSSHEYLDYLGGKIRHYVLKTPYQLEFPYISELISVYYFEFSESGLHTPDTLLNIGENQVSLSNNINTYVHEYEKENCPVENELFFINYSLNNLHWKTNKAIVSSLEQKQSTDIMLSGSIEITCNKLSKDYSSFKTVSKNTVYNFNLTVPVIFEAEKLNTKVSEIIVH